MKKYKPFERMICLCDKQCYKQDKREFDKQIKLLLSLQSGLGQSSQGYKEDWEHIYNMEREVKTLGISIKTALGIL